MVGCECKIREGLGLLSLVRDSIRELSSVLGEYDLELYARGSSEVFGSFEDLLNWGSDRFEGDKLLVLHVELGERVTEHIQVYVTDMTEDTVRLMTVCASVDDDIVLSEYVRWDMIAGPNELHEFSVLLAEMLAEAKDDAVHRLDEDK